jgi:hypothetical protein
MVLRNDGILPQHYTASQPPPPPPKITNYVFTAMKTSNLAKLQPLKLSILWRFSIEYLAHVCRVYRITMAGYSVRGTRATCSVSFKCWYRAGQRYYPLSCWHHIVCVWPQHLVNDSVEADILPPSDIRIRYATCIFFMTTFEPAKVRYNT